METTVVRRDANGRLLPGGPPLNPAGRPVGRIQEIRELLSEHQDAIVETLVGLLKSDDEGMRLAACREMLDRLLGRAPLSVDTTSTSRVEHDIRALYLRAVIGANQEPPPTDVTAVPEASNDATTEW
jgi:hypothetical protein